MANISTGSGDSSKKGKPKKKQTRVDFTPMVDMNMLLLTFFMFCTTLSKPQVMELILPMKDEAVLNEDDKNKVKDSKAITIILGANNKAYYHFGKITPEKYQDWQSLTEIDYSPDGLRAMLLSRNREIVQQIADLRLKKYKKEISDEQFKTQSSIIRNDEDGLNVIIMPTDDAVYKNLVDALDEMQITSIGIYSQVELDKGNEFLLKNYLAKGTYVSDAK